MNNNFIYKGLKYIVVWIVSYLIIKLIYYEQLKDIDIALIASVITLLGAVIDNMYYASLDKETSSTEKMDNVSVYNNSQLNSSMYGTNTNTVNSQTNMNNMTTVDMNNSVNILANAPANTPMTYTFPAGESEESHLPISNPFMSPSSETEVSTMESMESTQSESESESESMPSTVPSSMSEESTEMTPTSESSESTQTSTILDNAINPTKLLVDVLSEQIAPSVAPISISLQQKPPMTEELSKDQSGPTAGTGEWYDQKLEPRKYFGAENLDQIEVGNKSRTMNDVLLNEMQYSDFNRMPPSFNAYDFEYGYSFIPPKDWYPVPPYPPACVSEKTCPVCPVASDSSTMDYKDWNESRRVMPPDVISTAYIKDKLNSGR